MENIYRKIEKELDSLSEKERKEILIKLREEIDRVDKELTSLLNKRTLHSVLIGRVKRSLGLPTYSPEREKAISKRISSFAEEPLRAESLLRIYERIIDESRAIQREEKNKGNIFKVSTTKMRIGLKNLFSRKDFIFILIFFFAALGFLYYIFFTPNYYNKSQPIKFEITKGESLNEIVDSLYQAGIIPNKTNMKIAAYIYGAEKKIRAGRFYIPDGLSYVQLLDFLLYGKADYLVNVKLYKGSRINSMAATLKLAAFIDSASFVNKCSDRNFLDSLGIKYSSLEGYLFPKTYEIYERSSAKEVIKIIYNGFKEFMNDTLRKKAEETGLNIHEILTLASIVQGETNKPDEMPAIAKVYLNRLKRGMKLQADPTVQYFQEGGWKRLLYEDLRIDNPYNTYIYKGLPPGPINNPGKEAILAVLYPDKNNYLFFVADGTGRHKFASTYSQHLRNVREYRRWLNSQKDR